MKSKIFCIDNRGKPCTYPKGVTPFGLCGKNTLRDIAEPTISEYNPYICEFTKIWWIWKHYQDADVGNPDFVGFCHYRRFFNKSGKRTQCFFRECVKRLPWFCYPIATSEWMQAKMESKHLDALACVVNFGADTNGTQFEKFHGHSDVLREALILMGEQKPMFAEAFKAYFNLREGYMCNMFFTSREHFFDYCATIFPVIQKLLDKYKDQTDKNGSERFVGFVAERLTGAYWYALKANGGNVLDMSAIVFKFLK